MKTNNGFQIEVGRGPNWLFLTLTPDGTSVKATHLADELWSIVARHFVYRVVLEFVDTDSLSDTAVAQIDQFRRWLDDHGGAVRVCGLDERCSQRLESQCAESRTRSRLRSHSTLAAAVLGPDHAHDGPPPAHRRSHSSESVKQDIVYEATQAH